MSHSFPRGPYPGSSPLELQALEHCQSNSRGAGLLRCLEAGFSPDSFHYHDGLDRRVSPLLIALLHGAWRPAWVLIARARNPLLLDEAGELEAFPLAGQGLMFQTHDAERALRKLIALGADPNAIDRSGQGALSAVWRCIQQEERADLARLLVSLGCDPSRPARHRGSLRQGDPVLKRLARLPGAGEAIGVLIQAGADANEIDTQGETPLATAIRHSLWDNALALAEATQQVDTPDLSGRTPLSLVCSAASSPFFPPEAIALASRLIQLGANPRQARSNRSSCLQLLLSSRHPGAIALAQRLELDATLPAGSAPGSGSRL